MKAALAVWDGRISPVFDVSREVLVLTIENGIVTARRSESIDALMTTRKIDRLIELGVETLVCGAISEPLHRELTSRGMKVLGFVAGEIDEVVQAFLAGMLPAPALSMPGCCRRQNRFRGGREQGEGGGRGGGRGSGLGSKGRR